MQTSCNFQIVLAVALLAARAAVAGEKAAPVFSHPREITHPYLPLAALKQDILINQDERVERTAKPEVQKTFTIGNQTVAALAVEDKEFTGGKVTEITLDYFAQDDAGNVYYLGEDVDTYKDGKISGHAGAWLLGRDTKIPGVLLPAHPQVGDKFASENVPGITREDDEVVSISETVTVPAGTFHNCVKVKETPDDGKIEYKFYAPGVGVIAEMDLDERLLLKSHTTN